MKKYSLALIIGFWGFWGFLTPILSAQEIQATQEVQEIKNSESYTLRSSANWQEQSIDIQVSVPIPRLEVQSRYYANEIIDSNFSVWLYDSAQNLQINSQQTLEDFWGGRLLKKTYSFFKGILKKKHSVFDPGMQYFRASYRVALYPDLVQIWANSTYEREPLPPAILSKDSPEFSGLILYAPKQVPVHGQPYKQAGLKPALFPRIYNEHMKLIMSFQNVTKRALLAHGMVSYSQKDHVGKYRDRIGDYPFRILVREVFGSGGTDIVIANSDAEVLLANPSLRNALILGRILILQDTEPNIILIDQ